MKINNSRGISLIVLVITIVVTIILVSVILLNLQNNNPIDSAKEVRFKSDIDNFKDEISISYTNGKTENFKFKFSDMDVSIGEKNESGSDYKIKEYIPSITEEYIDRLGIKDGNLIYKESEFSEDEIEWLKESGAVKAE